VPGSSPEPPPKAKSEKTLGTRLKEPGNGSWFPRFVQANPSSYSQKNNMANGKKDLAAEVRYQDSVCRYVCASYCGIGKNFDFFFL